MKTKRNLFILWTFSLLGLLICAVETYESPFTRRKRVSKLGTPKPYKLSSRGDRQSSQRLPAVTSPLSPLRSQRRNPPAAPVTPRSMRQGEPRTNLQSDFANLPDVSVTCSTSDFVLRIKPAFYGLGADAEELKLGNSCKSNGVLKPYGDLLFTYPLTACDAVRQSPRGYLVYKFVLHYEPSPKRFPSRSHRIDVDIECRFQRNHHVHQLTVQPTWKTAVVLKRLKGSPKDFQIELMDDSWSRPAKSQVYHLGKTIHFQVSAPHLPTGGKVYINSCYASGSKSSLKYTFIDNFGCMLDSKREPGSSQFISRTDSAIRFSLKAFQFTSDPDTEVNVHCLLFVTSEDPGPAHKSCSYKGNRWKALTGEDSICECCDSQCVTSKPRRGMMEGSAVTESLLVSDQPYTTEDGLLPISPTSVSMSREGEATIIHYFDEQHRHENLWGSADTAMFDEEEVPLVEDGEESGVIVSIREPEIEELGVEEEEEESGVRDSNEFEEDGSGYLVQEEFSENEEEEGHGRREDEISEAQWVIHLNQTEGELLEQMLPSEVSQSVREEENRKQTGRGEDDDRMMASEVEWKNEDLVDDREMTWYFTWR